jgi:3-hydroxypropanoate dehydrogenase
MAERIPQAVIDQMFLLSRTQNKWLPKDVTDAQLREIIEITRMGPTSANCQPARFVFLKSAEAKAKLSPLVSEGNRDKMLAAPVCCIVAHDMAFYENLPRTFPHRPAAKDGFIGKDAHIQATAFRNGTLQGAYLMIAARSVGLDVGGMSGFDNAGVDAAFLAGTTWKSNFLVNIGYGDPTGVMQRLPRLSFDEYAKIV